MPGTTLENEQEQHNTSLQPQTAHRLLIPLPLIMLVALVIRMLAAFFSKGYAFSDDHFDVITIAQGWLDGFPLWLNEPMPPRHSMFYVLIHYAIFYFLEAMGNFSPDAKMTVVRALHGLYSLLIVYFGYKLTELLSNKVNARLVGLMLALMWFMPFMSVRNLVEMVCIPPFLAAFYLIQKQTQASNKKWISYFWAGVLFGLAFVFRYHTALLGAGAGLVLLYQKRWQEALALLIGFLALATLIQGTIDIIFFDYPFHSVVTYILYNTEHAYSYSTGPIYRFVLTILGFLVPPISVFLVIGYARCMKLAPYIFWGGLIFFVTHSLFPNKQERFILPLLPLVIILGVVGWKHVLQQSETLLNYRKAVAAAWVFFWVINIVAALGLAFTYTKKSRIAPLVYLSDKQDLDALILDFGNHRIKTPPLFYLNRVSADYDLYKIDEDMVWQNYLSGKKPLPTDFVMVYTLNHEKKITALQKSVNESGYEPDYVVIVGSDDLQARIGQLNTLYPNLRLEHTTSPSLYDKVLHFLNPRVHQDEKVRIYKIE